MKRVLPALCVLGLLALAACSDNSANMTPAQKQAITDLQGKLDQINAQIDKMKKGASSLTGEARTVKDKAIEDARAKLAEAQDKLAQLKKASSQEWDKFKADVEAACQSASAALTQGMAPPVPPKMPGQ